uniref:uncharacterized protein isoform X2 n=1 Tax=Myxine glutinosa TaxID=7769 RepID=UPI00358FB14E
MPARCIVAGCSNTYKNGVSMHGFPQDAAVRKIWIAKVKLTRAKWQGPTVSSVICSAHFEDDSYNTGLYSQFGMSKLKRLKANAIPTRIEGNSNLMEKKRNDGTAVDKREKLRQDESQRVDGKRKLDCQAAPPIFVFRKALKPRTSLQECSDNITTRRFVKKRAFLPDHSYCAALPANCSTTDRSFVVLHESAKLLPAVDCGMNCDKTEEFEFLEIKVEDLQSDGPEEEARDPEDARKRMTRENETAAERQHRLARNAEYHRFRRENETADERQRRNAQDESQRVDGKRKLDCQAAPPIFVFRKSLKPRTSLQECSDNITTQTFVKKRAFLPDHSYCAALPANYSTTDRSFVVLHEGSKLLPSVDCGKNCDKTEEFEILEIKVEDLQSDGPEEEARDPEDADHVKKCGDKMEGFEILSIKVEDLLSDSTEEVRREDTQMMGVMSEKSPQVLTSVQDLASELQELQQEFKQTQHSGRDTVDRLEGKRRQLYQFVDEAVDLVKSCVNKRQKEKLSLLAMHMAKLNNRIVYLCQAKFTLKKALQELQDISFLQGYTDLLQKRLESISQFKSVSMASFSMLDVYQEEKNLDLLIKVNEHILKEIQNGGTPSLDSNSANKWIMISQDLRMATRTRTKQKYPEHPDRFDVYPQVLSSESFSTGCHYWEVDVSLSRYCRIGVSSTSMGRKGGGKECWLGENPESWCLQKYDDQYSACHNDERTLLTVPENPERFGFLLDCELGELRCFMDSQVVHVFRGNFMNSVKPAIGVYNYVGNSVRFCSFS